MYTNGKLFHSNDALDSILASRPRKGVKEFFYQAVEQERESMFSREAESKGRMHDAESIAGLFAQFSQKLMSMYAADHILGSDGVFPVDYPSLFNVNGMYVAVEVKWGRERNKSGKRNRLYSSIREIALQGKKERIMEACPKKSRDIGFVLGVPYDFRHSMENYQLYTARKSGRRAKGKKVRYPPRPTLERFVNTGAKLLFFRQNSSEIKKDLLECFESL